jgi:hypothetical protein
MSSISPFLHGEAFNPEMLKTLTTAFDGAWKQLDETRHLSATPNFAAATRERLAKRIIDMARAGERSADRLRRGALVVISETEQPKRQPSL